ncbi:putative trans-zeatin O-beta-D-glucosyltransferase [Helianthus annuus]|nr:putative trans-zeatin O-beta-D-glucosyltransferase [Helianthus annuus]
MLHVCDKIQPKVPLSYINDPKTFFFSSSSTTMASTPQPPLHIVLFPFMAKGHTIPFLQLARRLFVLRRNHHHSLHHSRQPPVRLRLTL